MGVIQNSFNQVLSMAAVGAGFAKKSVEENRRITEGLKEQKKELGAQEQVLNKDVSDIDTDISLAKFNYSETQKAMAETKKSRPRSDEMKAIKQSTLESQRKSLLEYTTRIGELKSQRQGLQERLDMLREKSSKVEGELEFQKNKLKYGLFAEGGKK